MSGSCCPFSFVLDGAVTGFVISSNSELSTVSSNGTSVMVELSSVLLPATIIDSSLVSFDCFDWLPGDAGGVIDLRLKVNGRLKMSTSDCPFRLPSEALPVVINAGYNFVFVSCKHIPSSSCRRIHTIKCNSIQILQKQMDLKS